MPVTERSRDIVSKNAQVKIVRKPVPKTYAPGIYTQHKPTECDQIFNSRPIHLQLNSAFEGKEIRRIIERDHVRDLLVPSNNINVHAAICKKSDLDRLKEHAKVITREERQAQIEKKAEEKAKILRDCERRREKLQEIDERNRLKTAAKKPEKIDYSDDALVLDKFTLIKQEQEEEVRKANRIILTTKCQIIRDAQIAEKIEIDREFRREDLRLEKMVHENVEKALKEEEIERQRKREQKEKHANELRNQLQRREVTKLFEAQRIEEESKAMARAQRLVTQDISEKEREKREKIQKIKQDLQRANELSEYFKNLQFEEQRLSELRIHEYMRQKNKREAELVKERQLQMEQKERERERLLMLQTKLLETKSNQTEMNMRREQEQKEREFRRKEKEAVIKRKKLEQEILAARNSQLEYLKREKAVQLARDEDEHRRICEELKEALEKDKQLEELKHINNKKYREEIIRQMREREVKRREEERKAREEFIAHEKKERERVARIKNVIAVKVKEMRDNQVPEKFIKDVERQLMAIMNGDGAASQK